jgi:hypothetical protein
MKRLPALWRNQHLQPKTAFSRLTLVHRVDLEGTLRVDSGCPTGRSAGSKRKICTIRTKGRAGGRASSDRHAETSPARSATGFARGTIAPGICHCSLVSSPTSSRRSFAQPRGARTRHATLWSPDRRNLAASRSPTSATSRAGTGAAGFRQGTDASCPRPASTSTKPRDTPTSRPRLSWPPIKTSSGHSAALRRGAGAGAASCEVAAAPIGSRHPLISP